MKGVVCRALLCLLVTFTLLTLHGCTSASSSSSGGVRRPRNTIDDQIVEALENFRSHMTEGWVELGIPPLDPLHLPHVVFNISNEDTHVYGSLSNVTLNLLSTFTIDLVHTNLLLLKVDLALGLPLLDISGDYDILGQTGVIPVYGEGPFWLDAYNLGFTSVIDLGVTEEGYFGVSTLDLDMTCNKTDVSGWLYIILVDYFIWYRIES
ncbi:hypothetical protein Pcinc_018153 [Petrolisthes cinctipes]|uniref:Uncharacterized protein n=1 Tax=Petrolisthes cinctipes TaxID=88211 RepID=A0AAE1KMT6_PETCI|nr:hypothetical protein Pcinc_018153 [Petrolisthes cinctipes]